MQEETSNFKLIAKRETDWGETPAAGTWDTLRVTGESLEHNKDTEESKEIQDHAQTTDVIQTGASAAGALNFELTWGTWDEWFEATLRKAAVTVSYAASTISAAAADNSINDSSSAGAGNFPATIVAGMWIRIAGFTGTAGNNGTAEVVSRTAAKIVIKNATNGGITLVNDAEGEEVTITAKMIRNGTTKFSMVAEKQFLGITKYMYFNGLRVDKHSLTIPAKGLITGSFDTTGKQGVPGNASASAGGSVNAANSNEVYNAANNVAYLREGGTTLATILRNIKFDIGNNLRYKPQVGSLYSVDIGYGKIQAMGSLEAYFEDRALLDKFIAHTESSLVVKLTDDNGKVIVYSFPRCVFTKGAVLAEGENQDILLKLEFKAFRHVSYATAVQIDIL